MLVSMNRTIPIVMKMHGVGKQVLYLKVLLSSSLVLIRKLVKDPIRKFLRGHQAHRFFGE